MLDYIYIYIYDIVFNIYIYIHNICASYLYILSIPTSMMLFRSNYQAVKGAFLQPATSGDQQRRGYLPARTAAPGLGAMEEVSQGPGVGIASRVSVDLCVI